VTIMEQSLRQLRDVLDRYRGSYAKLNGARDLGDYLDRTRPREDEELLTEPILADLLESVLGFPRDSYFPQLGSGGLKPDFTPHDLVAHRFVLDAKSSTQELDRHEGQIRAYIDQRQLDYGVLFNLRELRVYRRGERDLLEEGRVLVEAVERLVCRLYGLPVDLEDGVVAHAVRRAARGLPAEEA